MFFWRRQHLKTVKALVDSIANLSRGFRQIRCRIVKDRPSPCLLVIWAHYVSAMTILTVRGGPVRSGPVQKTARMRGGRWNPHRATQNQRGLHRSRLTPTAQCICRGAGPSAALWQTHEPDDTPAKGRLPTSEPLNVAWWTLSGYSSWLFRRRGPGRLAGWHGSL